MSHFILRKRYTISGAILASLLVITLLITFVGLKAPNAEAAPVHPNFNRFLYNSSDDNGQRFTDEFEQQQYSDRAYPSNTISHEQEAAAYEAFQSVLRHPTKGQHSWKLIGPVTGNVPGVVTYTGRPTTVSGRTTSIAVGTICNNSFCPVWLGTAGGGVWATLNGLAEKPTWFSASKGLRSNAIGSIVIDPTDRTGRTLYVGTGEPNGSSDSEAGVGLYKSTNYGASWTLVDGSVDVAFDRSIASIAIDPTNHDHIVIGTALARHGSSSVNGGRFTPPGAPKIGLYESTDGGDTFKLVFSKDTDPVDPTSANGSDFFRGGVSKVVFDRTGLTKEQASRVYFSMFDYGLFRGTDSGSYEQVFASAGGGTVANSATSRTEFALAPMGSKLRIYLGDTGSGTANFYRVDNANVTASTLTDGKTNPGWLKLSNPKKGTPGYSSYNFCETQCSYDMWVASPAGHPDTVWIGGSMNYAEIFTPNPPSNGRAVQRSTDLGVSFTDMTNDAQKPFPLGLHPDQHAVAFAPGNPDIAITTSDGGVVRTDGGFVDSSADCDKRGISGDDLTDCKIWLKAIPTRLVSMNDGLSTLQFQSVTVNPSDPRNDLIGGTQDNGTWAYDGKTGLWFETIGGDGGQSVIDVGNPNIRMHTYFNANGDVNFKGVDPLGWDFWADPLQASKEAQSFYVPLIGDPKVSQTMFIGLEHVWRTQDSAGPQAYLDKYCNEYTGDYNPALHPCGDWVPLGAKLSGTDFGTDKGGNAPSSNYVVAIARAPSDKGTMWVATRRGRVFVTKNADAANPNDVKFTRIDTAEEPTRFVSGITVDPKNPDHAFISYSGYDAYTPDTPGHVYEVHYDAEAGEATWDNSSNNLGDEPITSIAYDGVTGDLYISSDFGVAVLPQADSNADWRPAAPGLPFVAVYGLTISNSGRVLYAATHGRGIWRLDLGSK